MISRNKQVGGVGPKRIYDGEAGIFRLARRVLGLRRVAILEEYELSYI